MRCTGTRMDYVSIGLQSTGTELTNQIYDDLQIWNLFLTLPLQPPWNFHIILLDLDRFAQLSNARSAA